MRMPSSKTTKKTRQTKEEVPTSEVVANPETAKLRQPRATKAKAEPVEPSAAMRHRKAVAGKTEPKPAAESVPQPKALAATAAAAAPSSTPVVNSFPKETATPALLSDNEVAVLAYSYYAARGFQHGFAEEDWLRAEQVISSRTKSA
jgi:hypothetical protein